MSACETPARPRSVNSGAAASSSARRVCWPAARVARGCGSVCHDRHCPLDKQLPSRADGLFHRLAPLPVAVDRHRWAASSMAARPAPRSWTYPMSRPEILPMHALTIRVATPSDEHDLLRLAELRRALAPDRPHAARRARRRRDRRRRPQQRRGRRRPVRPAGAAGVRLLRRRRYQLLRQSGDVGPVASLLRRLVPPTSRPHDRLLRPRRDRRPAARRDDRREPAPDRRAVPRSRGAGGRPPGLPRDLRRAVAARSTARPAR